MNLSKEEQNEFDNLSQETQAKVKALSQDLRDKWEIIFKKICKLKKRKWRLENFLDDDNTPDVKLNDTYNSIKQANEDIQKAYDEESKIISSEAQTDIKKAKSIVDDVLKQGIVIRNSSGGNYKPNPGRKPKL